ncbi:MAG: hypothetical protein ABJB11_06990 [Ferruginibacter sp.]
MTDKQLKTLFDSIKDFDDFNTKVINRQDIIIKEGFGIIFNDNLQPATIDIIVNYQNHSFDDLTFLHIVQDMIAEKGMLEKQEIFQKEGITQAQLRNEIFYLKDNIYKVYDEYIEDMFFASDMASAHGVYLKKLQELLKLFNRDNILLINKHRINSKNELKDYLKSIGFNFIDKDAP